VAIFDVRDYGALGNGSHDDTSAIQAAINAANAAGGGDVYMSAGTYIVTGNNNMNSSGAIRILNNVNLYGDGMGLTEIKVKDGWDGTMTGIVRTPFGVVTHDYSIRDLTLNGNRDNTTGKVDGFFCGTRPGSTLQDYNVTLNRVEIKDCEGYGFDPHEQTRNLTIRNSVSHGHGLDGFTLDFQIDATIENNTAYDNDRHGFNVVTSSHDMVMTGNVSYQNGSTGIVVQRGSENIAWPTNINISGGEVWGNTKEGVLIKMSDHVTVDGVSIHNNGYDGLRIYGGAYNTVSNSQIFNNSQSGNNKYDEIRMQDYPDSLTGNTYAAHHNTITGNTIYDDALIRARNGVYENNDSSDYNTVTDNDISGVVGQLVLLTGEHSTTDPLPPGVIRGTASGDLLIGTAFADTVYGEAGNDTINAMDGDDSVEGGAGDDSISGGAGADTLLGGDHKDSIDGGIGADVIEGGAHADTLLGGADNDTINGGDSNDSMYGGDGDDLIYGGGVGALINDRAFGGAGSDTLHGESGSDTLYGDAGTDQLYGGTEADRLYGGTENDSLYGGDHNDTLYGDDGGDALFGDAGSDSLKGGNGNDTLDGGEGNDTVKGDANNDLLFGGGGNDSVEGSYGLDTLIGGDGNDTLRGGGDQDRFYFAAASGVDVIQDFNKSAGELIQIASGIYATAAEALTHVSYATGTAMLDLGGGNTVTLELVTSGLTAAHFEIV
jgi:Ca2+-binding RTX toxin-like protein